MLEEASQIANAKLFTGAEEEKKYEFFFFVYDTNYRSSSKWCYSLLVFFTGEHSLSSIKLQANIFGITLWNGCSYVHLRHISGIPLYFFEELHL